jgi:hypothetical protein
MTNAEAIAEATRLASKLESLIAEGVIPPRPNYIHDHTGYQRWYDEHVRCATPAHRHIQREHPSPYCQLCTTPTEEPRRVRRVRAA